MTHGPDLPGTRRLPRAELVQGLRISLSEQLVWLLMHNADAHGLPGPASVRTTKVTTTRDDVVNRRFARTWLNELWGSDITWHPTREV